jgi:hypothetical protein
MLLPAVAQVTIRNGGSVRVMWNIATRCATRYNAACRRAECSARGAGNRLLALLRAKPPKGGDAEPRGYRRDLPPRLPGRQRMQFFAGGPATRCGESMRYLGKFVK